MHHIHMYTHTCTHQRRQDRGGGAQGAMAPTFLKLYMYIENYYTFYNHRINVRTVCTSLLALTCYGKLKTTANASSHTVSQLSETSKNGTYE